MAINANLYDIEKY